MFQVEVTDEQLREAQRAFDMSALNGILGLAAGLRGRGLLDDAQIETLHDWLSKPLVDEALADNPAVQMMQGYVDEMFATLLKGGTQG